MPLVVDRWFRHTRGSGYPGGMGS